MPGYITRGTHVSNLWPAITYWNSQWEERTQTSQEFPEMANLAHCGQAWIPRKLVTFQVMRRRLGTDLQRHGTMKDAQQILRHASIRTTANVYMQQIPASVVAAINPRTRAILAAGRVLSAEVATATGSNGLQSGKGVSASA